MAAEDEDRVFEVEEDGSVVPLFGPAPLWLRLLAGIAGVAVWAGLALAVFGGAVAVGGALSWDWMWFGGWMALGGFLAVWVLDRALPACRRQREAGQADAGAAVVPLRRS